MLDTVTVLKRELRKALHVSKVERSINEAANTQLLRKRNRMAKKNARWLSGKPFMDELRGEVAPVDVEPVVDDTAEHLELGDEDEEEEEEDPC